MTIRSKHILFKRNGEVNVSASLAAAINEEFGLLTIPVERVSFRGTTEKPLQFRITCSAEYPLEMMANEFCQNLGIPVSKVTISLQDNSLLFDDPDLIIDLFKRLDYESPLNDATNLAIEQVNLLQVLLAETIRSIIIGSHVSTQTLELIEFNAMGYLSGVLIDSKGSRFEFKTTDELFLFLTNFAKIELPSHFICLIRKQVQLNAQRHQQMLATMEPVRQILTLQQYQFKHLKACAINKYLSVSLSQRSAYAEPLNHRDRETFKIFFANQLGDEMQIAWQLEAAEYKLIISHMNPALSFSLEQVQWLEQQLTRLGLISKEDLVSLDLQQVLTGNKSLVSRQEMPESVRTILTGPILKELLSQGAQITPQGTTYNLTEILECIEYSGKDPITRNELTADMLRPNHLVEDLVRYYTSETIQSPHFDTTPPPCLLDKGQLFENPVVDENGKTKEGANRDEPYLNRCVIELIEYYVGELTFNREAIVLPTIRRTIEANIARLSPKFGGCTDEALLNEDFRLPLCVHIDPITKSLCIDFVHVQQARQFELGLKRWFQQHQEHTNFLPMIFEEENEESATALNVQTLRLTREDFTIQSINPKQHEQHYYSRVTLTDRTQIVRFFSEVCHLNEAYLISLTSIDGLFLDGGAYDINNNIIISSRLFDWSMRHFNPYSHHMTSHSRNNIPTVFSIRAEEERARICSDSYSEQPLSVIEDELDGLDLSALKIHTASDASGVSRNRGVLRPYSNLLSEGYNQSAFFGDSQMDVVDMFDADACVGDDENDSQAFKRQKK